MFHVKRRRLPPKPPDDGMIHAGRNGEQTFPFSDMENYCKNEMAVFEWNLAVGDGRARALYWRNDPSYFWAKRNRLKQRS